MEKTALLKIILQDIKELETLVGTFTGQAETPPVLLQIAKSKTKGILEELSLLEDLKPRPVTSEKKDDNNLDTYTSMDKPLLNSPPEKTDSKAQETSSHTIIEIEAKPEPASVEKNNNPSNTKPEPATEALPQSRTTQQKTESHSSERQSAIIGEVLGKDKQSFNDLLTQQSSDSEAKSKFQKPIDDLRKAFGINDRFYYQRELFGGNAGLFSQTIDELNAMDNFESADAFLNGNFNWDNKSEPVVSFKELIRRRFLKH